MIPRFVHRAYAWCFGSFWLPCPRCGRMFGGHERHGDALPVPSSGMLRSSCNRHHAPIGDLIAEQQAAWGWSFVPQDRLDEWRRSVDYDPSRDAP